MYALVHKKTGVTRAIFQYKKDAVNYRYFISDCNKRTYDYDIVSMGKDVVVISAKEG